MHQKHESVSGQTCFSLIVCTYNGTTPHRTHNSLSHLLASQRDWALCECICWVQGNVGGVCLLWSTLFLSAEAIVCLGWSEYNGADRNRKERVGEVGRTLIKCIRTTSSASFEMETDHWKWENLHVNSLISPTETGRGWWGWAVTPSARSPALPSPGSWHSSATCPQKLPPAAGGPDELLLSALSSEKHKDRQSCSYIYCLWMNNQLSSVVQFSLVWLIIIMFYFYSAFQEPKVTLQNNTSNWQTKYTKQSERSVDKELQITTRGLAIIWWTSIMSRKCSCVV